MNRSKETKIDSRSLSKIIFSMVVVVLALYMVVNLFKSFWIDKIETEYLELFTYSDYTDIYGIALRDEALVIADKTYKNIIYRLSDGDRVAKSSVIASCVDAEISTEDNAKLKLIENKISQISESTKSSISLDLPAIEKNIIADINLLLYAMESNNISSALDAANNLHIYFNKKNIKLNGSDYYHSVLTEYEQEKDDLLALYNTEETLLKAENAGYFYTGYDGYEYLDPDDYSEFTVKLYNELMEMSPQSIPARYVGKIELSPSWYYYCIADSAQVSDLYVGQKVTLNFEFDNIGTESITFYVSYISRSVDGKTALRLRSDTINNEIFSLRKTSAQIVLSYYSGYKIPTDALRVVDGQDGIYVLSAKRVVFKPVNILYSTDGFSVVESAVTTGSKVLAAKDAVIIGGKELYDGKIVQQ